MRMTLSVKNQSIETSGLPKDYKEALCEYIWNGYEANATEVYLSYEVNQIGTRLYSISIHDNGDGIDYDTLSETFGSFLVSRKNALSLKAKTKSNKGKGRFSLGIFASSAKWTTVYTKENRAQKYTITLSNLNKQDFVYDDAPTDSPQGEHGTTVTFYDIYSLSSGDMNFDVLEDYLLTEFSWFLFLHKNQNYKLVVNGQELDYKKYINEKFSTSETINLKNEKFEINLIVWNNKIKEKFCCYVMNSKDVLSDVDTTTFNRNTVDFNHSVFIKSSFFDHYKNISFDENNQTEIGKDDEYYFVLKLLKSEVQNLIEQQISKYMISRANSEINKMIKERKTFPDFPKDDYGQLRKRDLMRVTKELYCAEPKIFYKLSDLQEKSLLAFLNLLLSSEERENVLSIVEQIVKLSPEQRKNFADVLKKTKLEYILDTIRFLEKRFDVINILKTLIYDLTKFTNERDHIQKIVEQHFWLFGEQYNLASADASMKKALLNYQYLLYGAASPNETLSPDEEENRRMDIFLCNSRRVDNTFGNFLEENIIVELKAPKVPLTLKVFRQIEDYMRYIIGKPQFNSLSRRWKFIAVCKEVSEDVKANYKAYENLGKPGLALSIDNFEVYALSWDDIFKSFDLRNSYLLEKLKFDRDELLNEGPPLETSRETADLLTKKATSL